MKKNIEFMDAQQMKQLNPETFEAPNENDLKELQVGDSVKVCAFRERFWAEIIDVDGDRITGRIDNILIMPFLKYNDTIHFESRHIYDIWKKDRTLQQDEKTIEDMKHRIKKKVEGQGKGHRRI